MQVACKLEGTIGRVAWTLDIPDEDVDMNILNLPAGYYMVRDVNTLVSSLSHYHAESGEFLERPVMSSDPDKLTVQSDGIDTITISGLPVPCTIKVGTQEYYLTDPNDTTFEFALPAAGTYSVTAEQFPYIPKTWEVLAV